MKFSHVGRVSVLLASGLLSLAVGAAQAEVKTEVSQAAASAVTKTNPKVTPGKVVPKVTTATGAIEVKGGDNQYPTGTIPVPPKPKKEGLEAAGAIKAKAAQP
ncbi:MAG TPA: hypothetical protein VFW93_07545 [Aquabacterium sp.]|uniref:hypothetical protein n=1 Tax=Aquabacterium sp. TaxID=1872578 RepID=UPI002E2FC9E5|nr:hypothetical protein [Aquabacterium sp.]HEX5356055.1 hypothetical protein [Aquabacterium sp.]